MIYKVSHATVPDSDLSHQNSPNTGHLAKGKAVEARARGQGPEDRGQQDKELGCGSAGVGLWRKW